MMAENAYNAFDEVQIAQESFAYAELTGTDRWITGWTPVRTGWTDVGTPTVTGRIHILGRQCFFQVRIVPGTTVAATGGTSYIELPKTARGLCGEASMTDLTALIPGGACVIDVTNSRVYVPSQSATGNTLAISGWYEI